MSNPFVFPDPPPFPNVPQSVESLFQQSTPDVVLGVIVSALVSMGVRADLWPQEDAAYSCMVVVANFISSGINNRIQATKGGWLGTALGAWLTWLALYMYGVMRTMATFATGAVVLTNSGGGSYAFAPFTATFQNPTSLATYTNTIPIALGPGPGTQQTVDVEATAVGSASNSAPGAIITMVTTMLGVTVTNVTPVLGIDEQTDPSLQLECWNAIAANSAYGPRQSIAYAVQTATNIVTGTPVNVNRWTISPSSHTGQVTVTLASPAGVADPNDVLGVAARIEQIARPMCVTVTTASATPLNITDQFTVWVSASPGLLASTVVTAMNNALAAFFEVYPIGGRIGNGSLQGLFASAIEGVLYGAWPGVYDVQGPVLASPNQGQPVDHVMLSGQVAIDAMPSVIVVLTTPAS